MFRILIVDDSSTDVLAFREALKELARPYQVDWVQDGLAALDFLYRRGVHTSARRPHLILMDMNMPRVSGLEAVSAIKSDPELSVIPTIMLSSSISPSDVRRSYQAHANGFVQKPSSLEKSAQLVRAIETFWMDLAVLPVINEPNSGASVSQSVFSSRPTINYATHPPHDHDGGPIAIEMEEAKSQAMGSNESAVAHVSVSVRAGCEEHRHLLDDFGAAVRELLRLHEDQFLAIMQDDSESNRFDLLIHMANEKKQLAKYAYIRHVESHGCADIDAIDKIRT